MAPSTTANRANSQSNLKRRGHSANLASSSKVAKRKLYRTVSKVIKYSRNAINKKRDIRFNAEKVVQNFKLKEGVTLKTQDYILKNKRSMNKVVLQDGTTRMTKRYFDKNLKGRHSRVHSAEPLRNISKITEHIRALESNNTNNPDQSEIIQEVKKFGPSVISEAASQAKSNRDMKVNLKNYYKFISDSTKQEYQRVHHPTQDIGISENSKIQFQVQQTAEAERKLYLMNWKLRLQSAQERNMNYPVEEYLTSKNLNFFHRKKKKGSLVEPSRPTTSKSRFSGMRQRRDTKQVDRNLVSAGGQRRNMDHRAGLKRKRPKSTIRRIHYIENSEHFS